MYLEVEDREKQAGKIYKVLYEDDDGVEILGQAMLLAIEHDWMMFSMVWDNRMDVYAMYGDEFVHGLTPGMMFTYTEA